MSGYLTPRGRGRGVRWSFAVSLVGWLPLVCLLGVLSGAGSLAQDSAPVPRPPPAPPPPPPPVRVEESVAISPERRATRSKELYSIGDPTDKEQYVLELINRARLDPNAEAQRLEDTDDGPTLLSYDTYGIDFERFAEEVGELAGDVPPLSMNAKLLESARGHSLDMLQTGFQGHYSGGDVGNGDTISDRVQAVGYEYSFLGENVYAFGESPSHAHAAFEVDWGTLAGETAEEAADGMQDPPGHRNTIHDVNNAYREVGIGIVEGENQVDDKVYGPFSVTQDFGTAPGYVPFVTGVTYFDLNGNDFYDMGEGIGGVRVDVTDSDYYAITSDSGGYSVPSANGVHTVTFSQLGVNGTGDVEITYCRNEKLDFTPDYLPPQLSGDLVPPVGLASSYHATTTPGVTAYEAQALRVGATDWSEGAEDGEGALTVETDGLYPVLSTQDKASGSRSFHLAHTAGDFDAQEPQRVTLDRTILVGSDSELQFQRRLAQMGEDQVLRMQVSADGGDWQTVWEQFGAVDEGTQDADFRAESVSLGQFDGKTVAVRFQFELVYNIWEDPDGSYNHYSGSSADYGIYVDDITVTNAPEISAVQTLASSRGATFTFTPAAYEEYVLRVRAINQDRELPFGPGLEVVGSEENGRVTCSLTGPAEARWKLVSTDGGGYESGWLEDDALLQHLDDGDYRVEFLVVPGYWSPAAVGLTVNGTLQPVEANYEEGAFTDNDADGMDDLWEQQIVAANDSDDLLATADVLPGDDFDGDGRDNETEYLEETDPVLTNIPLAPGWNLIALPRQPEDGQDGVAALFPEASPQNAWTLAEDPEAPDPYVTTETLDGLHPAWISWDGEEGSVSPSGTPLWDTSITLVPGWNLVAFPRAVPFPSDAPVAKTIWRWSPQLGRYVKVRAPDNDGRLLTGYGYWIFAYEAAVIVP